MIGRLLSPTCVATIAACGVLVLPLGCARRAELSPPEIHYGADVCDRCNMIISEERFAAAMVLQTEGKYVPLHFDDVGCLFERARTVSDPVAAFYVHDEGSGAWIEATTAAFVFSRQIHSPMGSGTLAYTTPAAAEDAATALGGETLAWNELRRRADGGELMRAFQPGDQSVGSGARE